MSRRRSLAVDLMSNEALWDLLYSDALQLLAGLDGGLQATDRRRRTQRVVQLVQELRQRGIQLSFHWE